jgi:hypothetical protein
MYAPVEEQNPVASIVNLRPKYAKDLKNLDGRQRDLQPTLDDAGMYGGTVRGRSGETRGAGTLIRDWPPAHATWRLESRRQTYRTPEQTGRISQAHTVAPPGLTEHTASQLHE